MRIGRIAVDARQILLFGRISLCRSLEHRVVFIRFWRGLDEGLRTRVAVSKERLQVEGASRVIERFLRRRLA